MPRRLLRGCVALIIVIVPWTAAAQEAEQLFNFLLDQAGQELQRQQQLEQQHQQQLYTQFVESWHACGAGDLQACQQALTYPHLGASDRRTLRRQRAAILEAKRLSIALEKQQQREAELAEERQQQEIEERSRQEAALAEERRRQEEAERVERARQEELARVERARVEEIARQQAEVDRLRQQRLEEERRLNEMRAFALNRDACRNYDVLACTTALSSPLASSQDRTDLTNSRTIAGQLAVDLKACEARSTAACDTALASPALTADARSKVEAWRTEASPYRRTMAILSAQTANATAAVAAMPSTIAALPMSTQITGALAGLLALTLLLVVRRRVVPATTLPKTPSGAPASAPSRAWLNHFVRSLHRVQRALRRYRVRRLAARRSAAAQPPVMPKPQLPAVPTVRDTAGAIAALELAYAYVKEVREDATPAYDDLVGRKNHLNTLSLATKKLALAERHDPDAVLEIATEDGVTRSWRINQLKSQALLVEGLTHQVYDLRRAVPALTGAVTADPENPQAHYALGLVHVSNLNKSAAVAAFRRAVALDPKNIDYRMQLDRAESVTGAEIAGYKAVRAGEHIVDTGIKTYNFIVILWNIFAFTWNTVTFPLRLVLRIAGHR